MNRDIFYAKQDIEIKDNVSSDVESKVFCKFLIGEFIQHPPIRNFDFISNNFKRNMNIILEKLKTL